MAISLSSPSSTWDALIFAKTLPRRLGRAMLKTEARQIMIKRAALVEMDMRHRATKREKVSPDKLLNGDQQQDQDLACGLLGEAGLGMRNSREKCWTPIFIGL